MGRCNYCKNEYDKTFKLELANGERYEFDSFECAIHAVAPACGTCGVRIVGHGLESNGRFFCCDHCAEEAGVEGLRDRV